MLKGIPCSRISNISMSKKIEWVTNVLTSLTTGRILNWKTTFFTRCELLTITPVERLMTSEKVFHIAIPAVRKTTKGISPAGLTLNPTLNTNHRMDIINKGLMNAQKKPRKEPIYRVKMSRLAISMIKNLCWYKASMKSTKLLNKFTGLRINFIVS
jgi:hypothetical protein